MANLSSSVRQWIVDSGIVGVRVYPDFLPQGTKNQLTADMPAIVYHVISDMPWYESGVGDTGASQARYQFDLIAANTQDVNDLELKLRAIMSGYRGQFGQVTIMGAFKQMTTTAPMRDVRLARIVTDYLIQYQIAFQSVLC